LNNLKEDVASKNSKIIELKAQQQYYKQQIKYLTASKDKMETVVSCLRSKRDNLQKAYMKVSLRITSVWPIQKQNLKF